MDPIVWFYAGIGACGCVVLTLAAVWAWIVMEPWQLWELD